MIIPFMGFARRGPMLDAPPEARLTSGEARRHATLISIDLGLAFSALRYRPMMQGNA
jgi:hypothetical protein